MVLSFITLIVFKLFPLQLSMSARKIFAWCRVPLQQFKWKQNIFTSSEHQSFSSSARFCKVLNLNFFSRVIKLLTAFFLFSNFCHAWSSHNIFQYKKKSASPVLQSHFTKINPNWVNSLENSTHKTFSMLIKFSHNDQRPRKFQKLLKFLNVVQFSL